MKKYIAIILTIVFLISLATSCTDSNSSKSSSTNTSTSDMENTGAESITYPLSDGSESLTVFLALNSGYNSIFTAWEDCPSMAAVQEQTGIKLNFIEPSETTATEQFNLMIAGGNWPDLFNSSLYTGGAVQAYSDGVILELTDLITKNAPDYLEIINGLDKKDYNNLLDDDGNMLLMSDICKEIVIDSGLCIRKDWLDELNMQAPTTTDDLYNVLSAFKTSYGCDTPFLVDDDGIMKFVNGAFRVSTFALDGEGGVQGGGIGALGLYQVDGKVYSTLQSDGYREYLNYFLKLYNEDLINKSFYSFVRSADTMNKATLYGGSGIWETTAANINSAETTARQEDPDYTTIGIPAIVQNEGDSYEFGTLQSKTSASGTVTGTVSGTVITTSCENPGLAAQFVNYFFTDTGSMLSSWGVEGKSYNINSEGNPEYTDIILNNSEGHTMRDMQEVYSYIPVVRYKDSTTLFSNYLDEVGESIATWSAVGDACTMPSVTLTDDESDEFTSASNDIVTYACEELMKFVVGESELNDETWNSFQEQIKTMGIDNCVSIYQGAYDRFIAR